MKASRDNPDASTLVQGETLTGYCLAVIGHFDEGNPVAHIQGCIGDEPVYIGDEIVGRISSGGYGHHLGKSLAMGYIDAEAAKPGTKLEIAVLGERRPAVTVEIPPYDPKNEKLRA